MNHPQGYIERSKDPFALKSTQDVSDALGVDLYTALEDIRMEVHHRYRGGFHDSICIRELLIEYMGQEFTIDIKTKVI